MTTKSPADCINVFLVVLLIIGLILQSQQFEQTTDYVMHGINEFMRPNPVLVEAFGDTGGRNYHNGTANQMRNVRAKGPPIGGTQLASYQLYQQSVNASTPTVTQLENISNLPGGGYGYINSPEAPGLVPPAGSGTFYNAAAVNFGNRQAELISPCAQNAPTFVSTSLLPKINLPGVDSWNVHDTVALANQDFLSATQQIGVDTTMGSLRNPSYDLRNNIPNPINVVSPWLNTTITPDLQRRPLDAYVPRDGIYGAGPMNSTYGAQGGPLWNS
jgi:hypothetical protein